MPSLFATRSPGKSRSETRTAIRTCIVAQTLGAPLPQVLINGGVLSLFILALGGTKLAVGSVFAVNFAAQLIRVFAAPFIDVARPKRFVLFWVSLSSGIFAGLLLAVPIMNAWGDKAAVWYVVGLFLLQRVTMNIGGHAWLSLLTVIIPGPLRGRFFGRMRATFQTASLLIMAVVGWYLGADPEPAAFQLVFLFLLVMAAARPFLFLRLPDPPPSHEGPRTSVISNIFTPLRDRGWREFILFWMALAFAANLGRPFIVPFLKEDLGFPTSVTAYASTALLLGMVLGLMPWGRLADRFGNKVVFLANIIVLAAAFALLSFTPDYATSALMGLVVGIASFALIGLAIGGLGIGHTVRQMYAAPGRRRSSYMAVFFTANGLVGGTTTVLAGALLDQFPPYVVIAGLAISPMRLFFLLVAVLILATALLLWRLDAVAEKPIQIAVRDFLALLPPSLTFPLRILDMDPHHDAKEPADRME